MNSNIQKYHSDFGKVLSTIKNAKQKVFKQVNASLIELYWGVGNYISKQVQSSDWGKSVVEELASYISHQEPDIKGFSANNIWRMKKFYETYKNLPQCGKKLPTMWTELSWSHHRRIMTLKSEEERSFYIQLCSK